MPAFYHVILSCCFFVLGFLYEAEDSDLGLQVHDLYTEIVNLCCVPSQCKNLDLFKVFSSYLIP